jgi:formyl-CoA transferase
MHNGVWSNASLVQGALAGATFAPKWSRRHPPNPLVNHYAAADSRRFLFCLLDPAKDWPNLCRVLDQPALEALYPTTESRREHSAALVAILDDALARRPLAEWTALFDQHDLLYGIVPSTEEVATDATMRAGGVFTPIEGTAFDTVETPFRLEGAATVPATIAPRVGEHTAAVLAELGYAPVEQTALYASGAAFAPQETP